MLAIRHDRNGIIFKVRVQPRSSKNLIAGLQGDALKIKLIAPPVDNAANRMCIDFLAKSLGVSKSSLAILSGHACRIKQVLLRSDESDVSAKELTRLKHMVENLARR
jgi:uncharacterized protein (TIGR00251 family)